MPETRFCTEFVEKPLAFSFCASSVSFGLLELGRVGRVEVEPVDQVRLADRLLEVVEDEHAPGAVGVEEVVPRPGHPRDLVVAPGDPGRVVGVGDAVLVVGVPPRAVVERRDVVRVAQLVAVEAGQQALLGEARDVLGGGPDQVVLGAGAELHDHRLEVVEVDLADRDAVLLREPLLERRVHVLRPVVDQEVAVDLGRDDRPRRRAVDLARDGAAREAVERQAGAGAGFEQIAAGQVLPLSQAAIQRINVPPSAIGRRLRGRAAGRAARRS